MNILVTGVGGPTPRSFVRAVKMSKSRDMEGVRFIGVDCNPLSYGLYDNTMFAKTYLVPRADQKGYWQRIIEIVDCESIDAAVVLPEVEVLEWSQNQSNLKGKVKTHLPDPDLATALVNKHRLHEYLSGSSLVPSHYKIVPGSYKYQELEKTVGNPFWIRSTEGSSGLGSLKISSSDALEQWISINPNVDEFIATEYLPGRNLACKMLYFDGNLTRTACAERVNYIMAKVAPSGITGNTSFGRLVNEPELVRQSEAALKGIAEQLNVSLNGIFTVDFKEDQAGNPKITEINIRHVAFTSSIAAGGANLPADTIKAMMTGNGNRMERIDYNYPENFIFLRDVDSEPMLLKEEDLLK
jgi:hypothetical protein